ncbi:MAG: DUF308 domain-containing protein [Clostridia bacterium]|nr:DUF308 domain-containing protein [Clostridia bacterium]
MEVNVKIFIKNFKSTNITSAIIFSLLGLFLIFFADFAANIVGYLLGVAVLLMGIVKLVIYFVNLDSFIWYQSDFLFGLFETLIGLFILMNPGIILASIPFVFGLILFIHGIMGIAPAIEMKQYYPESKRWIFSLVLAVGSMILGFIVFNNPFGASRITLQIIGACLIYVGISDFITLYRRYKASKTVKRNADGSIDGYVDVDYRDIK